MLDKVKRRAVRLRGVLSVARRLSALGTGPLARVRIFTTAVALGLRWILRRPSGRLHRLRVSAPGGPRTLVVSDYGELQVMRDIVLDEEYAVEGAEPRTVLDLGANIGLASAWFRERYPDARVIAVEPDPATFSKLERNLGGDDGVTLVNLAVSSTSGEVALFRPAGYSVGSSLRASGGSQAGAARIRACTLDELWAELGLEGLDLLKLDVEGAELDVLDGFSHLGSVRAIVGEAHPPLLDGRVEELFERLEAFDVDRVSESPESISFTARRR